MAEDNVKLVRRAVEAVNHHDLATLDAIFSEQGEFHSTFAASEGRCFAAEKGSAITSPRLAKSSMTCESRSKRSVDAGEDRLVVVVRVTGRGKGSGATVEQRNGQIWRFANGTIARIDSYLHPTDAFDAARLRP